EYDPDDAVHTTITNPLLIVEVLSVTTETSDRGDKWMHYQRIPSLAEYVLVSQEPRIEVFRRMASGSWEYAEARDGIVKLAAGPALDIAMLYADLPA
ncbi:MAG TPA: Uma2 family endonuclease, partial [Thermoanaerobaculia bacterium]|nr:Uma2 family endonuclease [Thermoanaerobaculia bacterium]